MRRIVNILAKMVSAIVLALIFLPLLVALLFEIPAAQNFVAREATEIISRKLGTRISIDRVDIVVVSVDLRGLVNQVDSLVAVAAEGIGKIVKARVEHILLVLDLGKRGIGLGQRGLGLLERSIELR